MLASTSSPPSSSHHHPKLIHPKTLTLNPLQLQTHPTFSLTPNPKPLLLSCKRHPCVIAAVGKSSPKVEEQKFSAEGLVTESLPNGMFRIKLDNADNIIGYISGKIRKSFIRILPGDRVKVEVSRYDTTRGRIVYRLRNTRDSN